MNKADVIKAARRAKKAHQQAQVDEYDRKRAWEKDMKALRSYARGLSTAVEITDKGKTLELFFTQTEINGEDWFKFNCPRKALEFLQEI